MPTRHFPLLMLLLLAASVCFNPSSFAGPAAGPGLQPLPPPPQAEYGPLRLAGGQLTFDLQERLRFEARENNFDFDSSRNAPTDDAWLLHRFRLGVRWQPATWLAFYAQGQDAREFFSDRPSIPGVMGAEGDDPFDLRQLYVEMLQPRGLPVTVRLGRQILSYGDERLIGGFEWNNIARTFDAATIRFGHGDAWVDAFISSVVVPRRDGINRPDWDNLFSGVYFHTRQLLAGHATEVYLLHLDRNDDSSFVTPGVRLVRDPASPGIFYDGELAGQFGKVRGDDHRAYAGYARGGYLADHWLRPRVHLEYSHASGDSRPGDGTSRTFENLYPTNHKFYGYMDLFAWRNLHNPSISFSIEPARGWTARADLHGFWLATTNDAWYRANGVTRVRPVDGRARAASNHAGSEIDLTLSYRHNRNFSLLLGYSYFFAGDYLKETGPADDAQFGYIQTTFSF